MRPLFPLAAALLLLAVACAGATPDPATEGTEPAQAGLAALPNIIEQNGIEVGFIDSVPEGKARLILAEALRDLHAATQRMQAELGGTIPLVESERYRKGGSREERRLAYAQEGSFARYYIERYGLQAFLDLALDDAAYADQPELWQRLEAEWRRALAAR